MKNECSIVQDLLPLYLEQLCSADTTEFVTQHLSHCTSCSTALQTLKNPEPVCDDHTHHPETALPLKTFHKSLKKKKRTLILTSCAATVMIFTAVLFIFPPSVLFQRGNPLPYLRAASKLDDDTAYVEVSSEDFYTTYLSRRGACPQLISAIEASHNATLSEQAGSGFIFTSNGQNFVVESEIYLGKYTVWDVPNQSSFQD